MTLMLWSKKPKSIRDVAKPLSQDALKRLTRVVVVDDEADSFPTDALRANGYLVEYWESLDAARLARLERGEFDIIVLDIQGIVPPGFSDTGDGLGVLRRLKRINPSQIIIACSGQSYRIDAMEFYRNADATLAKPISALSAMQSIDSVMQTRMGATQYWEGVAQMLSNAGVDASRIRALEDVVARAAAGGQSLSLEKVKAIIGDVGTIATVVELLNKAIGFVLGAK